MGGSHRDFAGLINHVGPAPPFQKRIKKGTSNASMNVVLEIQELLICGIAFLINSKVLVTTHRIIHFLRRELIFEKHMVSQCMIIICGLQFGKNTRECLVTEGIQELRNLWWN